MTFTKEQRKAILEKYLDYVNGVSDDLEDKSYFSAEELVMVVLDIVEKESQIDQK